MQEYFPNHRRPDPADLRGTKTKPGVRQWQLERRVRAWCDRHEALLALSGWLLVFAGFFFFLKALVLLG